MVANVVAVCDGDGITVVGMAVQSQTAVVVVVK